MLSIASGIQCRELLGIDDAPVARIDLSSSAQAVWGGNDSVWVGALVGTQLPITATVRAKDGHALAHRSVKWVVNDGVLDSTEQVTDAQGKARAYWRLPTKSGGIVVNVIADEVFGVFRTASVSAGPAVRISIPRDSVRLTRIKGNVVPFTAYDVFDNKANVDRFVTGSATLDPNFFGKVVPNVDALQGSQAEMEIRPVASIQVLGRIFLTVDLVIASTTLSGSSTATYVLLQGQKQQFSVAAKDSDGTAFSYSLQDLGIVFGTSDTVVAPVSADGLVTGKGAGVAQISVLRNGAPLGTRSIRVDSTFSLGKLDSVYATGGEFYTPPMTFPPVFDDQGRSVFQYGYQNSSLIPGDYNRLGFYSATGKLISTAELGYPLLSPRIVSIPHLGMVVTNSPLKAFYWDGALAWSVPGDTTSAVFADSTLVLASKGNSLRGFSTSGVLLWSRDLGAQVTRVVFGTDRLFVGIASGTRAMDRSGNDLWTAPGVVPLNGDSALVGYKGTDLVGLDASGAELWKTQSAAASGSTLGLGNLFLYVSSNAPIPGSKLRAVNRATGATVWDFASTELGGAIFVFGQTLVAPTFYGLHAFNVQDGKHYGRTGGSFSAVAPRCTATGFYLASITLALRFEHCPGQ